MFTGASKKKKKKREMDWQLVASYFTVKSMEIFCRRHYKVKLDIDPGYIFRLLLQFHSRKLNTM